MKPFLDTHILLYWLNRDPRLTRGQEEALAKVTAEEPAWVSDITLWEIATLSSLGRVRQHRPLRDWLEAAVAPPLVRRVSISPAVVAGVAGLPDTFHRDPADRIIVTSALTVGATLLTQDRRIIDSGVVATL